jgi:hypothetical protein
VLIPRLLAGAENFKSCKDRVKQFEKSVLVKMMIERSVAKRRELPQACVVQLV